jgi:hypothetical protein
MQIVEEGLALARDLRCSYCQSPATDTDVLMNPWCSVCRSRKWLVNWGCAHHWLLPYVAHLDLEGVVGKETWVAFVLSARDAEVAYAWLQIALFERRRTDSCLGSGMNRLSLPPPDRDTAFAGCLFRNEWEAKWACFFRHLGLAYDYLREGTAPTASAFWLPQLEAYMMITGPFPLLRETELVDRARWFAMYKKAAVYLLEGRVGVPTHWDGYSVSLLTGEGEWKRPFTWHECSNCGAIGLFHTLRADHRFCSCPPPPGSRYNSASPRLVRAYVAARYARFPSPPPQLDFPRGRAS